MTVDQVKQQKVLIPFEDYYWIACHNQEMVVFLILLSTEFAHLVC